MVAAGTNVLVQDTMHCLSTYQQVVINKQRLMPKNFHRQGSRPFVLCWLTIVIALIRIQGAFPARRLSLQSVFAPAACSANPATVKA